MYLFLYLNKKYILLIYVKREFFTFLPGSSSIVEPPGEGLEPPRESRPRSPLVGASEGLDRFMSENIKKQMDPHTPNKIRDGLLNDPSNFDMIECKEIEFIE